MATSPMEWGCHFVKVEVKHPATPVYINLSTTLKPLGMISPELNPSLNVLYTLTIITKIPGGKH